jgi:ABC-type proline/glycine betaine transport system substrate-binding protein
MQWLAVLLFALATREVGAAKYPLISNPKCFTTRPGTANQTKEIKIGVRSPLYHKVTSALIEILFSEYLGFKVSAYDLSSADDTSWGVDMAAGEYHIDIVNPKVKGETAMLSQYVTSVPKIVNDFGSVGFTLRRGLYVTPGVVQADTYATWYKWYATGANIQSNNFFKYSGAEATNMKNLVQGAGATWPVCAKSWCGSGALQGFWASPECQANPANCALVLVDSADTGQVEQLTKNFKLHFVHAFLGKTSSTNALSTKVKEVAASGKNVVFVWDMPDGLPLSLKAKRIAFPDWFPGCDVLSGTPTGTLKCDFADQDLHMLAAQSVRTFAGEAWWVLTKFGIFISDVEAMLKNTVEGGGTATPFGAACSWIKSNPTRVDQWAPKCITNPPAVYGDGDLKFFTNSLSCEAVLAEFPTKTTKTCFNASMNPWDNNQIPSAQPGKVNRQAQTIKFCYRTWTSAQIANDVAVILLNEFLGYSVVQVDMTGKSTADWNKHLKMGGCDVDLEQWQVVKSSDKYINAVIQEKTILNPGSIGYNGRSGLWVTPGMLDHPNGSPMANYWKYYTDITDAKTSRIARYDELGQVPTYPPTPMAYTGGSNKCTSAWCAGGAYAGFYVPEHCKPDTSKCFSVMMAVSVYDTGYFETLGNALKLNMIYGYYGWGLLGLIDNIKKNATTDVVFYWYAPDPVLVKLGANRISFPDPSNGCNKDRDNNNLTKSYLDCDYPVTPLQKMIAARVKNDAPEAYYSLSLLFISKEDINNMLKQYKSGGGDYTNSFDVACWWINQSVETVQSSFAPKCISDPTPMANLKQGEKFWDASKEVCEVLSCKKDEVVIQGTTNCRVCPSGQLPDPQDPFACKPCDTGMTPNRTLGQCTLCPLGHVCKFGAETPLKCEAGKFTGEQGKTECTDCQKGKFQPAAGQSACEACPGSMTTKTPLSKKALDCLCPENFYKPLNVTNHMGYAVAPGITMCKVCPPGMVCSEGSDQMNIPCDGSVKTPPKPTSPWNAGVHPVPKVGHMVRCDNPLSAYKCLGESGCPGNGVELCLQGLEGIACGRCRDKWFRDGDKCSKCNDVETSNTVFPALPIVVGPVCIVVLYLFSRDGINKWNSPGNSLAATLFVSLVYVQTLAAIRTCFIQPPKIANDGTSFSDYTYDLVSLLRPQCTTFTNFKTAFVGKLMIPVVVLIFFLVVFLISVIVGLSKKNLRMDGDVLSNCYWAVFNTFFIGIAQQTFTLFQCYPHPNGDRSMRSQADVLCYEGEWNTLVGIAGASVIAFCGGFLVLNIWIIIMAPKRFNEDRFRKRWKFLFIKFRPSCWWWGVVLLIKGIWLNLPTVLFDYGAAQILWLQAAVVGYQMVCFAQIPWRVFTVNILDILSHSVLVFLFGFVTHFVDMGDMDADDFGVPYLLFAMFPLLFGFCVAVHFLKARFLCSAEQDWDRAADELYKAFHAACDDKKRLLHILPQLPFADVIQLNGVKNLLEVEMGFNNRPNTMTDQMLLKMSSRTRLISDFHTAALSRESLSDNTADEGKVVEEVNSKSGNSEESLQESISKMKGMMRPNDAWLCTALESAVAGRTYDVDKLRKVKTETKLREDVDTAFEVPQENMLRFQLMHGMFQAFSPRVVPELGMTSPRSGAATPRSGQGTPRSNMGTPRGGLMYSPRSQGTPPDSPRTPLDQ